MTQPESKFYNQLKIHMSGHFVRIENTIARGTPDIYWSYKGVSMWIEAKIKEGTQIKVRPEQLAFMLRELHQGDMLSLLLVKNQDKSIDGWFYTPSSFEFRKTQTSGYYHPIVEPDLHVTKISNLNQEILEAIATKQNHN